MDLNKCTHLQKINKKIKLYIRIFPSTEFDWDCLHIDKSKKVLYIQQLLESNLSRSTKTLPKYWKFRTDGILHNCCQSDIYATIRNELLESVLLGTDHVLVSYGQNCSGKTFTLSGLHNQFDLRGLVPRFVSDLFKQRDIMRNEFSLTTYLSVVDIYNSSIFDILSKPKMCYKQSKEVKRVKLKSILHCFDLLFKAESQRMCMYNNTYNSHLASCIVTFTIKLNSLMSQNSSDKTSKVHFIDLAGVETIYRNHLTSFKDKQSQGDANLTKSLLEIFALRCQISKNTNKRDNNYFSGNQSIHNLTKYLGNSFSSTSLKTFFCHIRPSHEDLKITLSLLKFGMVYKCIPKEKTEMDLKYNTEDIENQTNYSQETSVIGAFQKENSLMEISQSRIDYVRRSVTHFLKGEVSEFELMSMVNDCSLILSEIKNIIKEKPDMINKTIQIDSEKERFSSISNAIKEKTDEKNKRSSLNIQPNKEAPVKQVSFKTPIVMSENKKLMKEKGHPGGKIKGYKNIDLQSAEVQVNLIEPNLKMPTVDSRENHWAKYLIAMPEIEAMFDRSTLSLKEKEKTFNDSKLKYEEIKKTLIKKQLQLKVYKGLQFIKSTENNSSDSISLDIEINLLTEVKLLEKELEINKQFVISNQIEWLDALYNFNDMKGKIEHEFKQFCSLNNCIVLERKDSSELRPEKSIILEISARNSLEDLPHIYNNLQSKYLGKHRKLL